jgi:TRAP-type C4-dicarboxylate transport system substrate-binding protein
MRLCSVLAATLVAAVVLRAARAPAAPPPSATAGPPATLLRIATVAPDGTAWARELRAWARDVESATEGAVHLKIYFGGIAGDELTVLDRVRREQLDGAIGSELCTRLAPSLKVARVIGACQTREENAHILARLRPTVDAEFLRAGFINFGEAGLGPEVLFTREPVRDLAGLRKLRLWVWDSDQVLPPQARALGLTIVQTPLDQAGRAFDEHQLDGFITVPTAALAFQWTTQARYLIPLRISFRSGCLIVAARAFDALPAETQRAFKSSTGKLNQRIEELGRQQDRALLGGLLARQGLTPLPETDRLRFEFFDAARAVRAGARVVSEATLSQVMAWLADYRAEHPPSAAHP